MEQRGKFLFLLQDRLQDFLVNLMKIVSFEILHFIMQLQRPLVLKGQYQNKLCIELLDVHSYNYHVFEIIADNNCI